ncbi:hypothetical protein [Bartonella sp. CB74]
MIKLESDLITLSNLWEVIFGFCRLYDPYHTTAAGDWQDGLSVYQSN